MTHIEIVKKSIAHMDTDCIVIPTSQNLISTGGATGAVFRAAGYEDMTTVCEAVGNCAVGEVVVIPGLRLKVRYIFHTVIPESIDGNRNRLREFYRKIICEAKKLGCKSIAIPLVYHRQTGTIIRLCWQLAIKTVLSENSDIEVFFAVLADDIYNEGQRVLLRCSIDAEIFEAIDRNMLQQNIRNVCHIFVDLYGNLKEGTDYCLRSYPTAGFNPEEILRSLRSNPKYIEDYTNSAAIIHKLAFYPSADRVDWIFLKNHIRNGDLLKLLLRLDDLYTQWYAE